MRKLISCFVENCIWVREYYSTCLRVVWFSVQGDGDSAIKFMRKLKDLNEGIEVTPPVIVPPSDAEPYSAPFTFVRTDDTKDEEVLPNYSFRRRPSAELLKSYLSSKIGKS